MANGKETIFDLDKRLWGAADELRANSKLKSSEYSIPVLGLIPSPAMLLPSVSGQRNYSCR